MRINFIKKLYKKWKNQYYLKLLGKMKMQNLTPFIFESVGIMAPNHPYWFVSSLGAIFAGGLRSESSQL